MFSQIVRSTNINVISVLNRILCKGPKQIFPSVTKKLFDENFEDILKIFDFLG